MKNPRGGRRRDPDQLQKDLERNAYEGEQHSEGPDEQEGPGYGPGGYGRGRLSQDFGGRNTGYRPSNYSEDERDAGKMEKGPFVEGPNAFIRPDERIAEDLNAQLMHQRDIDAAEIHVEVDERVVVLKGIVSTPEMKRLAEEVAQGIDGVKNVRNELKVEQLAANRKK